MKNIDNWEKVSGYEGYYFNKNDNELVTAYSLVDELTKVEGRRVYNSNKIFIGVYDYLSKNIMYTNIV